MTTKPHPVHKTQIEIVREWDDIALLRHEQISSFLDVTYHSILIPAITKLCGVDVGGARVIDIGCGTGHLTSILAVSAREVVGVDPSSKSVAIASVLNRQFSNVRFRVGTVEGFSRHHVHSYFQLGVANMVLMDCLSLFDAVHAIGQLLEVGASLVCTVTHPWFWSVYWGYCNEPWFSYSQEMAVEAPFRITAQSSSFVTTHMHRPFESYFSVLRQCGFVVTDLWELPVGNGSAVNSQSFPRYLAFRARLVSK